MKIKALIKRLEKLLKDKGNVEVFVADSYISYNHQYGVIRDFDFFEHWHETSDGDKKGILLGIEDPEDSDEPTNIEEDEED